MAGPDGPDLNLEYVKIGPTGAYHPVFLRDACTCAKCVDPSSKQKNFQTTDIPQLIRAKSVETKENGEVQITWENDIESFGPDHVSSFTPEFLRTADGLAQRIKDRSENIIPRVWGKPRITKELQYINYKDYMTSDEHLFRALQNLQSHGLLIIRGVEDSEQAVADLATRIGTIRDTFYGRTWDVKSVPEAKNVAYTAQHLGLHMDLQYMSNPPGLQLLHCLKNTCEGGASIFSDSFNAVTRLSLGQLKVLTTTRLAYHYRNAGEHYYYERPVVELSERAVDTKHGSTKLCNFVNYSPPFQAMLPVPKAGQGWIIPKLLQALRKFAGYAENPNHVYEYKLQEGECVIFNNRRILHGRKQFETETGERWLKGAYVDTDVFMSKWRVLNEQFKQATGSPVSAEATFVHSQEERDAIESGRSQEGVSSPM